MKHLVICRFLRVLAIVGMAWGVTASSWADYITLPVKWSQPITVGGVPFTGPGPAPGQIDGYDWLSDHTGSVVFADDFTSDGRPIVAVRWWGSYIGDHTQRPTQMAGPFDISFHLSNGTPHPWSLPVAAPLVIDTVTAQQEFVGWNVAGDAVYRYDAYLTTPFNEQAGVEYFIDIDKPTGENWGWHDTTLHYQDYMASAPTHTGPWVTADTYDLAFELMVPEPSTGLLVLLGGAASLGWRRRRASLS